MAYYRPTKRDIKSEIIKESLFGTGSKTSSASSYYRPSTEEIEKEFLPKVSEYKPVTFDFNKFLQGAVDFVVEKPKKLSAEEPAAQPADTGIAKEKNPTAVTQEPYNAISTFKQNVGKIGTVAVGLPKGIVQYSKGLSDWFSGNIIAGEKTVKDAIAQNVQRYQEDLDSGKGFSPIKSFKYNLDTIKSVFTEDYANKVAIKYGKTGYDATTALGKFVQAQRERTQKTAQPMLDRIAQFQDLENQDFLVKSIAGGVESMPYTLAALLPYGIGFIMNYGVANQLAGEQKYYDAVKKAASEGRDITEEEARNIVYNSVGSALIEAASEQIFRFGAATSGGSIKNIILNLIEEGGLEAAEEYLSAIGQGIMAKYTTNKNDPLFTVYQNQGGLITAEGIAQSMVGAFFTAGIMSGTKGVTEYQETYKAAEKAKENPTPENVNKLGETIKKDYANDTAHTLDKEVAQKAAAFSITQKQAEPESLLDLEQEDQQFTDYYNEIVKPEDAALATSPVEAVSSPSEAEQGNLSTLEQEVATTGAQTPTQASQEQIIIEDMRKQTPEKLSSIIDQLKAERKRLYDSARGDPETITFMDRLIKAGEGIVSETTRTDTFKSGTDLWKQLLDINDIDQQEQTVVEQPTAQPQEQPVYKAEPIIQPKVVAQEAAKAPSITRKDIFQKAKTGKDIRADVEEWVKTEEAQKELAPLKTAKDIYTAMIKTKVDIQGNEVLNSEQIVGGYLQLLAYQSWAQKMNLAPEGTAVNRYIMNMVDILRNTNDPKIQKKLEDSISTADLFHRTIADEAQIAEAYKRMDQHKNDYISYTNQLARNIVSKHAKYDAVDVIAASLGAQKIIESGDVASGDRILKQISQGLTESGRIIRSAFIVYKLLWPEYRARHIINDFNEQLDPIKKVELDNKVKVTVDAINTARQTALENASEDMDKATESVKEPAEKKEKEPLSPEKRLAKRIKEDVNRLYREKKSPDEITKMINRLFSKYKEVAQQKDKAIPASSFDVLADIVLNRVEYSEVWDQAQDIIRNEPGYKDATALIDYLDTKANPISANKFMSKVIIDNIKSMDKTVGQYAKEFYFAKNATFNDFVQQLAINMPQLGKTGVEYLDKYMRKLFKERMEEQRKSVMLKLAKQFLDTPVIKETKDVQESYINKLIEATYTQALDVPEIQSFWAKKLNVSELSPEMIKDIYDTMKIIAVTKDQTRVDELYDELATKLGKALKSTKLEQYNAIRRFNLLMNPASFIKNMMSNITAKTLYNPTDKVANYLLKRAGVSEEYRFAGDKVEDVVADSDAGRAVLKHASEEQIARYVRNTSKYTLSQVMNIEKQYFKNESVDKFIKLPHKILNEGRIGKLKIPPLGDTWMFKDHFARRMYNKLVALNYKESLPSDVKEKMIETAMEEAKEVASVRTFRTLVLGSEIISNLRKATFRKKKIADLTAKGKLAEAKRAAKNGLLLRQAIDFTIPFVTTGIAITTEGFKFSPYALIETLGEMAFKTAQNKRTSKKTGEVVKMSDDEKSFLIKRLSQALVGTVTTVPLGFFLAMFGFMDGAPPKEEKERELWKLQGRRAYSLRIPGVGSLSIDWLQPVAAGLMMGANIWQSIERGGSFTNVLGGVLDSSFDAMLAGSLIDNLDDAFSNKYDQSKLERLKQQGTDWLFQSFPTILKRFNKVVDPYVRNAYSGDAASQMIMRAAEFLPFMTFALPKKVDIWGRPVTQSVLGPAGLFERLVLNFASPFFKTKASTDDVTKAVIDVYENTKESIGRKALPTIVDNTFDLSAKEYEQYLTDVGQGYYNKLELLMSKADYSRMTDEAKAKAFAKIYEDVRAEMKDKYSTGTEQP